MDCINSQMSGMTCLEHYGMYSWTVFWGRHVHEMVGCIYKQRLLEWHVHNTMECIMDSFLGRPFHEMISCINRDISEVMRPWKGGLHFTDRFLGWHPQHYGMPSWTVFWGDTSMTHSRKCWVVILDFWPQTSTFVCEAISWINWPII